MKNEPSCVHILHKTLNLPFRVVVWPSTAKKCTKIYNTCADPWFFSLNSTQFCDVLVAVAEVASNRVHVVVKLCVQ